MKCLTRPYRSFGFAAILGMGAWVAMTPPLAPAQSREIVQMLEGANPLLHSSSQGYLGVDLTDVDQEKAQALKLKEVRGAIITLIDHDAPAGQIGLKVNDVVLKLNGQNVEGAEQLRRILREVPAGRKISIEISRDGNVQTLAVELVDRRAMEHDVWNKLGKGGDVFAQAPGMGILPGGGDAPLPPGFHMPFFGSSLNVGALVEPLTSQMAEYLGVPNGLMVKQVARKSEAAAAGMKAFDVILKVGPDAIRTLADWDRSLRTNEGKPVQVTVLRDRKQQTLTLQVDSKHHSELEIEDLFPNGDCALVAGVDSEFAEQLGAGAQSAAEALRTQADALEDQAGAMHFEITPQQAEEFRKDFRPENFKLDLKQLDEMKQQTNELRKTVPQQFNFNLSEKQLKDMMVVKTIIVAPRSFDERQQEMMQREMDELKQQMDEVKALGFGDHI